MISALSQAVKWFALRELEKAEDRPGEGRGGGAGAGEKRGRRWGGLKPDRVLHKG